MTDPASCASPGSSTVRGDEDGSQRAARLRFLPRDELEHHRGHGDVDDGHHRDGEQDGAGDVALRILHLSGDVADLVVAAEAVHRDHCPGSERRPEAGVEPLRRDERGESRTLDEAGYDHPAGGGEHERQHRLREPLDRVDVPVEKEEDEHTDAGSGEVVGQAAPLRQVEAEVVRETHRAAGEREGRHQQDVEEEQEGHEPSQPEGAKRLPQINVRSAAPRERCSKLGVHESVGKREQRSDQPRPDDVRSAHRVHHERDGQEGTDPDHPDDVGGGGPQEPHPPLQVLARSGLAHGR